MITDKIATEELLSQTKAHFASEKDYEAERDDLLKAEIWNFLNKKFRVALQEEVVEAACDIIYGQTELTPELIQHLLVTTAGQVMVPRELEALSSNSKGLQEMARIDLKDTIETSMCVMGSEDIELLSKVEMVIDQLDQGVALNVCTA